MCDCFSCGTQNGLDASDREGTACRKCSAWLPFPLAEGAIFTCYSCLRAGKAAITKDTALGMVSWDQAFEGLTHGRPGLNHPDLEMVATNSDWVRARLPQEVMFELLRTPTYSTIQGDCWQFCCRQPMIFVGCWSREDFTANAPDGDGREYFRKIVQNEVPGLWEDRLHDDTGIYVFRCESCSRMTAHWDLA
jgi:uncharacterized protein CbrC (UPF0167 family)